MNPMRSTFSVALLVSAAIASLPISAQESKPSQQKKGAKPAPAAAAPAAPSSPPAAPLWPKEPDSFLGVKFGEPFTLAACPTIPAQSFGRPDLDRAAMAALGTVCTDVTSNFHGMKMPDGSRTHGLANLPEIGPRYTAYATTDKNGLVVEFAISLKQDDFEAMLAAFKDRYGNPTSSSVKAVRNAVGGEFNSQELTWSGKKISILMSERQGRIDTSKINLIDNGFIDGETKAQEEKRSKESQKF